MKEFLTKGNTLSVIDPQGSGESAVIARYELGGDEIYRSYFSVFHIIEVEELRSFLIKQNYSHLLVHSQITELREVLGLEMNDTHSYLLEAKGNGGWGVIKNWKKP